MVKGVTKSKATYEGRLFKSNQDGEFKVIEYINATKVVIEFVSTKNRCTSRICNILSGQVKDKMKPSVYGVGIVGEQISFGGERCKQRDIWIRMLDRCYSSKDGIKQHTYVGCTVSENFKYFPYFKEWCYNQIGFDQEGFALDKDILFKGNKVYSEETCCFVPQALNNLFTNKKSSSKEYPIGVSKAKSGKFISAFRKDGVTSNLGRFDTVEEAFFAYKIAKEAHIKEVADRWKHKIDPRVYEALMTYEIEITD